MIVKSPAINIGQKCVDRFEETGIEIYFSKTTLIPFVRFVEIRIRSRRWSSEVQGLVATNPEDISKMEVVGIAPSVPLKPGRTCMDECFRNIVRWMMGILRDMF